PCEVKFCFISQSATRLSNDPDEGRRIEAWRCPPRASPRAYFFSYVSADIPLNLRIENYKGKFKCVGYICTVNNQRLDRNCATFIKFLLHRGSNCLRHICIIERGPSISDNLF